eukprot:scaffold1975_cov54-Attheya_sp.AAC.1
MAPKKGGPRGEAIKVVFRVRPLNSTERQDGHEATTIAHEERGVIELRNPEKRGPGALKNFTFDSVFSAKSSQRQLYDVTGAPVVQSVLEGYNGTIFVYGQTGAGKTHTMEGVPDDPELRGIIPNAFRHIFDHVALGSKEKYLIRASYFEIYNEQIRDLLSKTPGRSLDLKESTDIGVYVKDLTSRTVTSVSEIDAVLQGGKKNRMVAATKMNAGSSRSHAVFTIVVECCSTTETGEQIRVGKLNLVDLAGSERQSKTGATGDRLKEAAKINLSLSALGNVISALVDGKSKHIPYRDSKLTRILQDSLGGGTKTVMCANAGPAGYNYDETLSTLRYACRAKNIKNKPIVNEDPKDAKLREYQEEIAKLKTQLLNMPNEAVAPVTTMSDSPDTTKEVPKLVSTDSNDTVISSDTLATREGSVWDEVLHELQNNHLNRLRGEQEDTEEERKALEKKLDQESKARKDIENQRLLLEQKLASLEKELMIGGEMADKAAKHEAELRKAEQDLAARREKELALARQMEDKEEANLQLERKYSSVNEEVQVKTKKLQNIWSKYQQSKAEIKDLQSEFQTERNDMLETIREMNRQLKLKDLVIANFMPPQYAYLFDDVKLGGCAEWDEEEQKWTIPKLEIQEISTRRRLVSLYPK